LRDKSATPYYVSYDQSSFENSKFKQIFEQGGSYQNEKAFKDNLKRPTRFNQPLQEGYKGTPFFGAFSRLSQPESGNPFSINFEIPPLPKIPPGSLAGNLISESPTNFMTPFRNGSHKQLQSQKPAAIAWPS